MSVGCIRGHLPPRHAQSMDKATMHMEVPYDERYFTAAAKSLLQGLLTRDPSRRLGSRGVDDIKVRHRRETRGPTSPHCAFPTGDHLARSRSLPRGCVPQMHPFFAPIDWGLLEAGLLPAPWVPETSINAAGEAAAATASPECAPTPLSRSPPQHRT